MRLSLLLLLCVTLVSELQGLEDSNYLNSKDSAKVDSLTFPASWVGEWKGTLEIWRANGMVQSLPMELHVLPIEDSDNYHWWIIYGADKEKGKRAYELKTIDKEKGIYAVDEHNTIQLESYLIGNKLISYYSVMGSAMMVTNEVNGDEMIFEIMAGKDDPVSITGGQKHEGEDIPEVKTFPITVQQKALLTRE